MAATGWMWILAIQAPEVSEIESGTIKTTKTAFKYDGEPGITGVSVTLQADIDSDGTVDYTTSEITDGNGNYLFNYLPAGNYILTTGCSYHTSPVFSRPSIRTGCWTR